MLSPQAGRGSQVPDGLLYFRLTAGGAYCLGLGPAYTPASPPRGASLSVLPSLVVQVVRGTLEAEETLVLETWAQPISDSGWMLDLQKALAAEERGQDVSDLGSFLRSRDEQPLPETVDSFMRIAQEHGKALRVVGAALLIECTDAGIAARIAAHPESRRPLLAGR